MKKAIMLVLSGLRKIIYTVGVTLKYWSTTTSYSGCILNPADQLSSRFMLHNIFKPLNVIGSHGLLVVRCEL